MHISFSFISRLAVKYLKKKLLLDKREDKWQEDLLLNKALIPKEGSRDTCECLMWKIIRKMIIKHKVTTLHFIAQLLKFTMPILIFNFVSSNRTVLSNFYSILFWALGVEPLPRFLLLITELCARNIFLYYLFRDDSLSDISNHKYRP